MTHLLPSYSRDQTSPLLSPKFPVFTAGLRLRRGKGGCCLEKDSVGDGRDGGDDRDVEKVFPFCFHFSFLLFVLLVN